MYVVKKKSLVDLIWQAIGIVLNELTCYACNELKGGEKDYLKSITIAKVKQQKQQSNKNIVFNYSNGFRVFIKKYAFSQ